MNVVTLSLEPWSVSGNARRVDVKGDVDCRILGSSTDVASNVRQDFSAVERSLTRELIEYMYTTLPYTIKRLLPADLKSVYVGAGNNDASVQPNPFQADYSSAPNAAKGGVHVTGNVTYNW